MASSFQIPLHFEDLKRSAAEDWQVSAQGNVRTEDLLTLASHDIPAIFSCDVEPSPNEAFTAMYNVINRYAKSNANIRKGITKAVVKLSAQASAMNVSHVKMSTFFLCGLIAGAEALSTRCKHWDKGGKESVLEALLALVAQIVTPSPFPVVDTDKIAGLLQRTSLTVLQNASSSKDKNIRKIVARLLATALKFDDNQQVGATSAIIHALFRQENIANSIAEVLHILSSECDLADFSSALVREVASLDTDALAKDASAAKSFSNLICTVAELDIEVIKSNLAGLLAHLDGPSYMMRNGIIHAIGILISSNRTADDPLLKVLSERAMKDVNAFTRSKALQTWATLADDKVVPFKLFPKICAIAASRLDDKGSVVRKSAAQLLGTLLQTNPFGPVLKLSVFQPKLDEEEKFEEERQTLRKEQEAAIAEAEENAEGGAAVENDVVQDIVENEEEKEKVEEDEDTRRLNFYRAAVGFIESVEDGLSKVYGMLRSKSITDVSEGVNFLVTVIQFQLDAAASGKAVRAMLPLALAREANIRAAAVKAYVTLLNPGGEGVEEKVAAMAVTNGLVSLATGATTGEVACLESLVMSLSKNTKECPQIVVTPAVVTVTWDLFSGKIPGATIEQRNSAAMLIGMFTATFPETLLQRVQILEDVGLNHEKFALWSCAALCRLPVHCDTTMKISRRVIELCKTTTDLAVVDRAITAIYRLHPSPESDVAKLIGDLSKNIRDQNAGNAVPVDELARFLVIIGQVAVKQLVRVESLIKTIKRTKILNGDNEDIERASAEADNMLLHAEKELVAKNSLLGRWGEMAARISADENAPAKLRASAVLCMTKLMCLQADYCERNLQLLFTILERAPQAHVRSNAVTALGDLAYRFPNQVEPWSSRIYAALRDEHRQVRTNTLMALTHLILNDQVKVKGQIVEIAICLLDSESRIADLSRIFFHELARKQKNSIYNILPDTISCLSRKEVNSADFKTVIGFLIALLDKDKHHEGMIDKLCHRFRATEGIQETRDLAYCVAQLNISEKGLKNLNDKFKSYANHLIDDEVYKFFIGVLAKGRKNCTSQNAVQMMDELDLKMENQRKHDGNESSYAPSTTVGADSEMASTRGPDSDGGSIASTKSGKSTSKNRSTAASTKSKKKQTVISIDLKKTKPIARRVAKKKKNKPQKKKVASDSESLSDDTPEDEDIDIEMQLGSDTDDDDDVGDEMPSPPPKKKATGKKKAKTKAKAAPTPRKQRASSVRTSRKKKIVYSDSESDEGSDESFKLGSDSD